MRTPENYIEHSIEVYDIPFSHESVKEDTFVEDMQKITDRLLKALIKFKASYPNSINIRFDLDQEYPQYAEDGDRPSISLKIIGDRPMNEKELAKAAKDAKELKARQEKYERSQYEALKKKFEAK